MKQDQRRLDNLAKAYHKTSGAIQEMWKKKWYELVKIIGRRIRESKGFPTSIR
jgi:hypothetical protein